MNLLFAVVMLIFTYLFLGFFIVGPYRDISESVVALELKKSGGLFFGMLVWPVFVIFYLFHLGKFLFGMKLSGRNATNPFKIVGSMFGSTDRG